MVDLADNGTEPDPAQLRAVLEAVKTEPPHGGGLRPVLTASARDARVSSDRDEETLRHRTKKHVPLDSKALI